MQFDESLRYLLSLGHETLAIKLGLRNITLLLERLGNPQQNFYSVQVAGTNGKGSTVAMLESICLAAELNVGLFTSPHLTSVTERVRIRGREISSETFATCATEVREASEQLVASAQLEAVPTFFEQVTAIALLAFQKAGVKLAILETGLGGRLDATSVAGAELVGITPIAMDHEKFLGDTLASIAAEKAAIIRPGVTAVVSAQPDEALKVILDRAEECGVSASVDDCEARIESISSTGQACVTFKTARDVYERVMLALRGRHQVTNAALAIRLAESLDRFGYSVPHDAIVKGLETTRHAGRLELIEGNPTLLIDGAHNPSGAQALRDYLDEFGGDDITLIFGAMRDKNLNQMAVILFPAAKRLILTKPDNPRAASLETLKTLTQEAHQTSDVMLSDSLDDALKLANQTTPADGLICIAGSLYLVGEYFSAPVKALGR